MRRQVYSPKNQQVEHAAVVDTPWKVHVKEETGNFDVTRHVTPATVTPARTANDAEQTKTVIVTALVRRKL